jgi:hypothetical protein
VNELKMGAGQWAGQQGQLGASGDAHAGRTPTEEY